MPIDPVSVVSVVPLSTWQQAGIIVLFILLLVTLLTWFGFREKNWQDWQEKQNTKWQCAYDKSNAENRAFFAMLSQSTEQDAQKRLTLTETIISMCKDMSVLVSQILKELEMHDRKTDERISDAMRQNANQVNQAIANSRRRSDPPKQVE